MPRSDKLSHPTLKPSFTGEIQGWCWWGCKQGLAQRPKQGKLQGRDFQMGWGFPELHFQGPNLGYLEVLGFQKM